MILLTFVILIALHHLFDVSASPSPTAILNVNSSNWWESRWEKLSLRWLLHSSIPYITDGKGYILSTEPLHIGNSLLRMTVVAYFESFYNENKLSVILLNTPTVGQRLIYNGNMIRTSYLQISSDSVNRLTLAEYIYDSPYVYTPRQLARVVECAGRDFGNSTSSIIKGRGIRFTLDYDIGHSAELKAGPYSCSLQISGFSLNFTKIPIFFALELNGKGVAVESITFTSSPNGTETTTRSPSEQTAYELTATASSGIALNEVPSLIRLLVITFLLVIGQCLT